MTVSDVHTWTEILWLNLDKKKKLWLTNRQIEDVLERVQ